MIRNFLFMFFVATFLNIHLKAMESCQEQEQLLCIQSINDVAGYYATIVTTLKDKNSGVLNHVKDKSGKYFIEKTVMLHNSIDPLMCKALHETIPEKYGVRLILDTRSLINSSSCSFLAPRNLLFRVYDCSMNYCDAIQQLYKNEFSIDEIKVYYEEIIKNLQKNWTRHTIFVSHKRSQAEWYLFVKKDDWNESAYQAYLINLLAHKFELTESIKCYPQIMLSGVVSIRLWVKRSDFEQVRKIFKFDIFETVL